jgi:D-tagatose-1,6-bisphosphate aldolase subunit GatZ/KbaZ
MSSHFVQGKGATGHLLKIVQSNLSGKGVGIYSICSANQFVLEAGIREAKADESMICIESTSNQVNQFGGYMGMTPAQFAGYVRQVASDMAFPQERLILGGDHLGPHVWQKEPAAIAMAKARELIRSCVLAGYIKIHLDASMRCVDDPGRVNGALDEQIVTERTADLCAAAEQAYSEMSPDNPALVYVIGTEVPIPGGEQAVESELTVTRIEDVQRTLSLTQAAFAARNLQSAWERVIAVVVQPGVEFGDATVFDYRREKAKELSRYIERNWNLVYEAHSTDYQLPEALRQMVEDHFAILKVGPWLTFAFREAVFALELIEEELSKPGGRILPEVRKTLDNAMVKNPEHWGRYYRGEDSCLRLARRYSYSDRSRYYWPMPPVQAALARLMASLSSRSIPLTLLSQYLPLQYESVRRGSLRNEAASLLRDKVQQVLAIYARACGMQPNKAGNRPYDQ